MAIEELLNTTIASLEDDSEITKAIDFSKGVPTLEKGLYRNVSPMLRRSGCSSSAAIDY